LQGLPPEQLETSPSFSPAFLPFNLYISLGIVKLLKTQKVEGHSIRAGEKEKHPRMRKSGQGCCRSDEMARPGSNGGVFLFGRTQAHVLLGRNSRSNSKGSLVPLVEMGCSDSRYDLKSRFQHGKTQG
jgi:hypothetical protein